MTEAIMVAAIPPDSGALLTASEGPVSGPSIQKALDAFAVSARIAPGPVEPAATVVGVPPQTGTFITAGRPTPLTVAVPQYTLVPSGTTGAVR